jgi:alpha-1,2-mannosyltransferase
MGKARMRHSLRLGADVSGRRTARLTAQCGLLAVAFVSVRWLGNVWHWPLLDLDVYRRGAAELLHGRSLYDAAPHCPHPDLPFTYPPFAALAFVPAYLAGPGTAGVVLSLASLGCYALVMLTCSRRLGLEWSSALPLTVLGLALEPVQRTLWLGQVNLLLAAMVVADCLLVPVRARGLLTGLAAGIKIVPGIYVGYFLLRRDWAAARRAAFAFAGTVAVSAAADRRDTTRFWTRLFWNPDHVGQQAYVSNQSVFGQLVRLTRTLHPPYMLYAVLALCALGLAGYAAWRQLGLGNEVAALTCVAFGGLLASPISWSHHWIWFAPASLVLVARGQWRGAGILVLAPALAPQWWTPSGTPREFHHQWWQTALCLNYTLAGVSFLVAMCWTRGWGSADRAETTASAGEATAMAGST